MPQPHRLLSCGVGPGSGGMPREMSIAGVCALKGIALVAMLGVGSAMLVLDPEAGSFARDKVAAFGLVQGCDIKGNISLNGERIYHVPGQKYYGATRVRPQKGERWFCTEAEARAAGWRRANT